MTIFGNIELFSVIADKFGGSPNQNSKIPTKQQMFQPQKPNAPSKQSKINTGQSRIIKGHQYRQHKGNVDDKHESATVYTASPVYRQPIMKEHQYRQHSKHKGNVDDKHQSATVNNASPVHSQPQANAGPLKKRSVTFSKTAPTAVKSEGEFGNPGGFGSSGFNDEPSFQGGSNHGNLVPCVKCGRTFAQDRIDKHMSICRDIKQRKVFNSSNKRVQGTEKASSSRPGRGNTRAQQKPKSNWRKNHGNIFV